ncbi:ACP S-malonyltransferase [Bacillus sp. CRN 9]|uniref:ACP S-malonyltransferase n=1 Tax=Cytobacillus horneckiae TaxID=549687 RepID=UPI0015623BAE|nr:ACP S-malonyltransferase [Bacillus sp. CRN 9]
MSKSVFLFPGMAKSRFSDFERFIQQSSIAQTLYIKAEKCLNHPLLKNFSNGDKSIVTERCAYFVNTLALLYELQKRNKDVHPEYVIGSSFGITTAAVYLGSLGFEDALKIVRDTAIVEDDYLSNMDKEYCTHFIYKYSLGDLEKLIQKFRSEGKWIEISVFISDDLIGIGSTVETINELKRIIKVQGKSTSIHTAELSHTSNLKELRDLLDKEVYSKYEFLELSKPFISDLDARSITCGEDLKEEMLKSVDNPVKFTLVHKKMLDDNIKDIYVIGPSNFFGAILKKDFTVTNIDPLKIRL